MNDLSRAIHTGSPESLQQSEVFDAIVIGAGAAGGLAAERLAQSGLRVLLLDAGLRPTFVETPFRWLLSEVVRRAANPNFLPYAPPALLNQGRRGLRLVGRLRQKVQTKCYAWERDPMAFVDDVKCPYTTPPNRPFCWIRARTLGGRMGIPGHGRQYFRLGADDFFPRDGESPAWPLSEEDISPWYADVERRLGIFGTRDQLPWLPDSDIVNLLEPTSVETALMKKTESRWPGFKPVLGRFAPPADTLEGAARTKRLTLRQGAVVREIVVRDRKVSGVKWFDQQSGNACEARAPLVFLCASALESTRILMLSKDAADGRPLAADSNALGHYLMDHIMMKAEGSGPALPSETPVRLENGRCVYLPRFDARNDGIPKSRRGFGVQVFQADMALNRSYFHAVSFSEMLPRHENSVKIHPNKTDHWGIPTLHISCSFGEKDLEQTRQQTKALRELADTMNVSLARLDEEPPIPGSAIHECGTARMGLNPTNSVLDRYNQCWDASGLYVTDSSSFPSQGSQNPTLTVMALTARACDHALRSR
jgi:choline dehydrogenase-like flavoprotein